jgi:hypothetical protein
MFVVRYNALKNAAEEKLHSETSQFLSFDVHLLQNSETPTIGSQRASSEAKRSSNSYRLATRTRDGTDPQHLLQFPKILLPRSLHQHNHSIKLQFPESLKLTYPEI